MRKLLVGMISVVSCVTLRADFSYQETTQMTGGALVSILRLGGPFTRKAREPIVSTVLIKGNRMATLGKENSTIIDLDKESITEINLSKKNLLGGDLRADAAGHGRCDRQGAGPAEEETGKTSPRANPTSKRNSKCRPRPPGKPRQCRG